MAIRQSDFGKMPDGRRVALYELTNRRGLTAKVTSYGARWTEMHVPDRQGKFACVTLGFNTLDRYLRGEPFFGPTTGRVANRIAGGEFTLDGKTYYLPKNDGAHTLHGGPDALDKKLWDAEVHESDNAVRFNYVSPNGECGFPGTLMLHVTYTLTDTDELRIDYTAHTDKPTPVNLTNHAYFNLRGAGSGDVLSHEAQIHASRYTPVDATLIPTGELRTVRGTAFDFTSPRAIGERIAETGERPGYDHNFVLDGGPGLAWAARIVEPESGRVMEIHTTEPGVQFYTGNFLDGSITGIGGAYGKHGGFCLECQHFPDAVHHPHFPNIILRPGETYRQTTAHRFMLI